MTTLVEGNLQITLPAEARARKFDDPSTHGLLHRHMKAVDFVIELSDLLVFLEVKDPEHPRAPAEQRESFLREFLAEEQDVSLVRKFRDSRLYEWACGDVDKPVHYWVIVAIDDLGPPELANRADILRRKLPVVESLPDRWKRRIVDDCRVFNIRSWNEALPAAFRLERVDT